MHPRKPIAEEEKIITERKLSKCHILVKKSSLYDKIGREPKSPRTAMKTLLTRVMVVLKRMIML